MRRAFAVLVLLAAAASQASVISCPMNAPAAPSSERAGVHAHHGTDHDEGGQHSSRPDNADCRMVLSCAGAVLASPVPGTTRDAPPTPANGFTFDGPASITVVLPHDTPPPRRSV